MSLIVSKVAKAALPSALTRRGLTTVAFQRYAPPSSTAYRYMRPNENQLSSEGCRDQRRMFGWLSTNAQKTLELCSPLINRNATCATSCPKRFHGEVIDKTKAEKFVIYIVDKDGNQQPVDAWDGYNLLELCHENEIPVEGACEGSLACSTCHVICGNQETYDAFPEPSEREEDLLDMAPGLTETSRLSCQLMLDAKKHKNAVFKLPPSTRNFYVDGHVPKPH